MEGYCNAMTKAGLQENINVRGNDFSTQNGYIETKLALMSGTPISAIFALSSTILLGSIKAVQEQNLSVPQDMSIVSFDNNVFLDYLNPPVTRVCQPIDYLGIVAVKMLMDSILGKEIAQPAILLQPTITFGNSVTVPPNPPVQLISPA